MRNLNQRIVFFVIALVILSIPAVYADPVSIPSSGTVVVDYGTNHDGSGGEFSAKVNGTTTFNTFCVEIDEVFSPGTSYYYTVDKDAIEGGGGTMAGVPITNGTALLYSDFMNGTLDGVAGFSSTDSTKVGQLQAAIWLLQGYTYKSGSGWYNQKGVFINNDLPAPATMAAALVAYAGGVDLTNSSQNYVYALNLWTAIGSDGKGEGLVQSQLVYVPEPGLILLLGIGMGAVTLIGFRFKA